MGILPCLVCPVRPTPPPSHIIIVITVIFHRHQFFSPGHELGAFSFVTPEYAGRSPLGTTGPLIISAMASS